MVAQVMEETDSIFNQFKTFQGDMPFFYEMTQLFSVIMWRTLVKMPQKSTGTVQCFGLEIEQYNSPHFNHVYMSASQLVLGGEVNHWT